MVHVDIVDWKCLEEEIKNEEPHPYSCFFEKQGKSCGVRGYDGSPMETKTHNIHLRHVSRGFFRKKQ